MIEIRQKQDRNKIETDRNKENEKQKNNARDRKHTYGGRRFIF